MKRLTGVLAVILLAAALILGRMFFFHTLRIEGTSMNHTLQSGDVVLVLNHRLNARPERGDIVECSFPMRDGTYVKRVVGLPGEKIEIIGSDLYIDGQLLSERYVSSEATDYAVQLGEDQYLLLGDNRAESYDSRETEIGPVGPEQLIGRVVCRLWPMGGLS